MSGVDGLVEEPSLVPGVWDFAGAIAIPRPAGQFLQLVAQLPEPWLDEIAEHCPGRQENGT